MFACRSGYKRRDEAIKKLIVSADDFGMTREINRAVIECHSRGVVTSASICPAGRYFAEAAALSRSYPSLDIGLHAVLTEGTPVSPPSEIPSLVNGKGRFLGNDAEFAFRYAAGLIRPRDIEEELNAQFDKAMSAGLPVTHLDSHRHVHLLPLIAQVFLKVSAMRRVPFVRLPFEPLRSCFTAGISARLPVQIGFNLLSRGLRRRLVRGGLRFSPCAGLAATARMDIRKFRGVLSALRPGIAELVVHPGGCGGRREAETLTDVRIRELLSGQGVSLTDFRRVPR